jgi:hypothetical protein
MTVSDARIRLGKYCKDLRKVSTHVGCSRTMGLEAWFLTRSTVVGRGVRLIIEHTYVYTFSYSTDFTSEWDGFTNVLGRTAITVRGKAKGWDEEDIPPAHRVIWYRSSFFQIRSSPV